MLIVDGEVHEEQEEVNLSGREIGKISVESDVIAELYLADNRLTAATLENLQMLKYLSLSNNRLTDVKLENLPNLRELSLSNNRLTDVKLENLPNLVVLYLNDNPGLAFLGNVFSLRWICIGNTSISFVDPLMVRYVKDKTVSPREHAQGVADATRQFLPYPIAEEIVPEIEV